MFTAGHFNEIKALLIYEKRKAPPLPFSSLIPSFLCMRFRVALQNKIKNNAFGSGRLFCCNYTSRTAEVMFGPEELI